MLSAALVQALDALLKRDDSERTIATLIDEADGKLPLSSSL
jgi:hypothetical protein